MKEQLISFETAKLAKEKGFNEECDLNYCLESFKYPTGMNTTEGELYSFRLGIIRNACAPTQSLLQKWLREKHNMHIEVRLIFEKTDYTWDITQINPQNYLKEQGKSLNYSYEEALEKGLFEALQLIK